MSASTGCGWRNDVRQPLPACTGADCLLTYGSVMSALEAAEQPLAKLSRAEKAQVLQWAARDLGDAFPGIESRPGVCGGEPCIVRTRIPACHRNDALTFPLVSSHRTSSQATS